MPKRAPVSSDRRFRRRVAMDYGPAERWQHSGRLLQPTEEAGVLAARASCECLLDRLAEMGLVSLRARAAGLRLREDFIRAGLVARVAGRYDPTRVIGNQAAAPERSAGEEAAYRRWQRAVQVVGLRLSDVTIGVACLDEWAPDRLLLLRAGLERLAVWYQLPDDVA